jgi:hypothetical protein
MFGHKSLPSRIFSFGGNPALTNADRIDQQMFAAHRYRNLLVETEQKRREKVDAALRELSPKLFAVEKKIEETEAQLEEQRAAIKRDHVMLMLRAANDPKKVGKVSVLKKELKKLYAERKKIRTKLFASRTWKAHQKETDAWAKEEDHRNRDAGDYYWGTYLQVDQSMSSRRSGAPPRFMRWNGDGHLAVQIQNGMSVAEALSGEDPRLQIKLGRVEVDGSRTAQTGIKRKLGNAVCRFRIGTDENREPIFADIPFTMHRPLPDEAQIKWVHLIRRRISTKSEWRLQFVVSQKVWEKPDRAQDGTVGLHLGWRLSDQGDLRVAVWAGSDGQTGELELPADWLGEMKRTEDIRSIRDQNFNDAKKSLSQWLAQYKTKSWVKEDTESIAQWKSAARLAALTLRWRDKRVPKDGEIFTILEEWRKRDKHLYEFEANLRDQLIGRRDSLYRNFAAELRRKYRTAKIKLVDRRKAHELPKPEEQPKEHGMKAHARDACLSRLVCCLKESMAETLEISPKELGRVHQACGSLQEPDPSKAMHTCRDCGEPYDQDENTAKLLLYTGVSSVLV